MEMDTNQSKTPDLVLDVQASQPALTLETPAPATPTLTLETAGAPAAMDIATAQNVQLDEMQKLTPQEQGMVKDFARKIDINNSAQILQYGAPAQQKISSFSQSALNNVKAKDMGEVGSMITGLITELKGFDAEEEKKGLFGMFKKAGNHMEQLKLRYSSVEKNVDRIVDTLEGHRMILLKDVSMLDKMYEMNLNYYKELTMYILAGKEKLREVMSVELPALRDKAHQSGTQEDAQAANHLAELCNRFEKKLHDLDLTRTISMQMAPQIRLVQNNDSIMVDKIQSSIVNTIPLWKNQMVLTLGLAHSQKAIEAQRQVTDVTNELLRKNADTLKTSTIEAAKESERGIVDIETLKHTNESLISTLDEVLTIQQEGRSKRLEAEQELRHIENELKNKLLEVRDVTRSPQA